MNQNENPYRSPITEVAKRKASIAWPRVWRWTWVGSLVGAVIPTGFVIYEIISTVSSGHREQGQLYHEDGPLAYFILIFILWLLLSIPAGVFFGIVGGIAAMLRRD